MAKVEISYRDLQFEEHKDKVKVTLMGNFWFEVPQTDLRAIGEFTISPKKSLLFTGVTKEKAEKKMGFLIAKHITNLKSFLSHPATYIHASSGIPLMGTLFFGIVDKGTDMIEVKPIAGCNMSCMFCSVDEGPKSKKKHDFIVECEYLVEELEKILDYKAYQGIDVYLNPHGEPLIYPRIELLVEKISKIKWVNKVIIITSGFLLSKEKIDAFVEGSNGKAQLNISLCAIDPEKAKKIAGVPAYNLKKLLESIRYAAPKMDVLLTPVIMHGVNDDEMEKLVEFSKEAGCKDIKMQNFLTNKRGRNPVKEISFEQFGSELKVLEDKHKVKLMYDMHKLPETKELPRPFKRGEAVKVRIMCKGRYKNEYVGVAGERSIVVRSDKFKMMSPKQLIGKDMKVKMQRSNHNIFVAEGIV